MLTVKKRDLKKKGLGNKPNASEPLEDHQIEQMWSSGAIDLQNPRWLFRLVWWINVTHVGMRAFKGQYDCQIEDFTVNEEGGVKYKERQTKNRQGDEESSRKRAKVQHQNMENRWRRERSISSLCRVCRPPSSR